MKWTHPQKVDQILTGIKEGQIEVLQECPAQPLPGEPLRFLKSCAQDDRYKCDAYTPWKPHGSEVSKRFNIHKESLIIRSEEEGIFQKMIWQRDFAVFVEYLGNPKAAKIRKTPRTPKHIMNRVGLNRRPSELLRRNPGLHNLQQVINKRSRITAKKTYLQNSAKCLEEFLSPYTKLKLPMKLKDDFKCLIRNNSIMEDILDKAVLSLTTFVVPIKLWLDLIILNQLDGALSWIVSLKIPEYLFVPVCFKHHFMLGIITKTSIILLDSFYKRNPDDFFKDVFGWLKWIARGVAFCNDWKVDDWKLIIGIDFMEQQDKTECGVIVPLAVLSITRGWDLPEFTTIRKQARNRRWLYEQSRKKRSPVPRSPKPLKKMQELEKHLKLANVTNVSIVRENVKHVLLTLHH